MNKIDIMPLLNQRSDDLILADLVRKAETSILPEVLSLAPELPVVDLSKKIYNLILEAVDNTMRPMRRPECELLMLLEDVFTQLNAKLIDSQNDHTEFVFNVFDKSSGTTMDLRVNCMGKTMFHFNLKANLLIPMLMKRYAELRVNVKI